jgi:hypothetical protein
VNEKEKSAESTNLTAAEEAKPKENPGDVIGALQAVHQCQTRLVILADQKANALIGVLTVVFTILFTNAQHLFRLPLAGQIGFFCFLIMEMAGVVFALLAIFPKNISGKIHEKPEQMSNPLFFGVYTQFKQEDYVTYLMSRLTSGASARRLLLTDYYQVGTILKQKYSQLRRAYMLAVGGFALLLLGLAIGFLVTIISGG